MVRESPKQEVGGLLLQAIKENVILETADWAIQRVNRVQDKLNNARPRKSKFAVVIPWMSEFTAFTCSGKYVFISRSLFQMCRDDDMVAFIVAHEIAHHDLGHLHFTDGFFDNSSFDELRFLCLAFCKTIEKHVHGPQDECDADRYAIDLCIKAGYDPTKCLALFDILEQHALYLGDVNAVIGPDESDDELSEDASLLTKARIWIYQHKRGYLPIQDRKKLLMDHVESSLTAPEKNPATQVQELA